MTVFLAVVEKVNPFFEERMPMYSMIPVSMLSQNDEEKSVLKKCLYCGKALDGRKRKYCNGLHKYRYLSIKNDTQVGKLSVAQCLRMTRAGRSQRAGRVGCRYN